MDFCVRSMLKTEACASPRVGVDALENYPKWACNKIPHEKFCAYFTVFLMLNYILDERLSFVLYINVFISCDNL